MNSCWTIWRFSTWTPCGRHPFSLLLIRRLRPRRLRLRPRRVCSGPRFTLGALLQEYIEKLRWVDKFVRDEVEPLDQLNFSPCESRIRAH